ncbi:Na/Pi symporter [uncultured Corynebacterium sp.]|uniref:Na/Pi symporter n=1 Tax=uncultured Corynebacterium sp. TaxID=159447 RepID=UPI0025DF2BFC|nr:Na/Pi symporter [uncultured Corynebacterium sp.]
MSPDPTKKTMPDEDAESRAPHPIDTESLAVPADDYDARDSGEARGDDSGATDEDRGDEARKDSRILGSLPDWALWLLVPACLYVLIVAIGVIGDGFSALGEDAAEDLFSFASNPIIAVFVGILATSIIQSSSTTTALVVTAVGAGALPLEVGIPMIMGANVGTSVTGSIASLGHIDERDEFRRAFAATTVNDFFNLLAIVVILPLELLFSPLRRTAEFLADLLYGTVLPDPGEADVLGALTDPVVDVIGTSGLTGNVPGNDAIMGSVTIALGVAMIFLSVSWLGKILKILMVGKSRRMLVKAVDGRPATAIGAGFAATMATQSSSVTTSVMVPFAGAGTLTTKQIYPLTLGANIGTTFTAIIAALAVTGDGARTALIMALVHLCFNLLGILLIFVIPILRNVPVKASEFIAAHAADNKFVAIGWIASVFFVIPALAILIFGVLM